MTDSIIWAVRQIVQLRMINAEHLDLKNILWHAVEREHLKNKLLLLIIITNEGEENQAKLWTGDDPKSQYETNIRNFECFKINS